MQKVYYIPTESMQNDRKMREWAAKEGYTVRPSDYRPLPRRHPSQKPPSAVAALREREIATVTSLLPQLSAAQLQIVFSLVNHFYEESAS